MESLVSAYSEVWLVDCEFNATGGNQPDVVCIVAHELKSNQKVWVWADELADMSTPPYGVGEDCLFVAYYASAEIGCHLALGWDPPAHVLDLFVEFRNMTNGVYLPQGRGLVGALSFFGLPSIDAIEKDSMRDLVLRGGPWSEDEQARLLEYCDSDVCALRRLLPEMVSKIDMPRALLRGRYTTAAARIEHVGVPIDGETLERLRSNWTDIQENLIQDVDSEFDVYVGRRFSSKKFASLLERGGISWPRLESGQLDLSDATFKERAMAYPQLLRLRELRVTLSQMRLAELAVGEDDRNRCLLSVFQSRTGRNQPSSSRFIFGLSAWFRGLIKPKKGFGIAYLDWSQQEFGIAAALSGDRLMLDAYASGDPYLEFAKQAGAVPAEATKETHKTERDRFKACVLAVQYGMGAAALAKRIDQPTVSAQLLLEQHRDTYKDFWKWSDAVLDHAMINSWISTVFGWRLHVGTNPNPRALRNFPMQANGAEMLRLACCFATEAGISVCAPVHDALLIEAPIGALDEAISLTQELMGQASEIVLQGLRLRTDAEVFRYPDRYMDPRGKDMWQTVMANLPTDGT